MLFGLLAGTNNSDRALITGLCNFIRDMGGCIGIAGKPSRQVEAFSVVHYSLRGSLWSDIDQYPSLRSEGAI